VGDLSAFEQRTRHLPHWEQPGTHYFVTFCLRRPPAVDLIHPPYARVVVSALRHFDGQRYFLHDYTVMPDHVHLILQIPARDGVAEHLWQVTHSVKSRSAQQVNRIARRKGRLWQPESYDHIIRSHADYLDKANYILGNALRKRLVERALDWPWYGTGLGVGPSAGL